eukprot:jgi/Mesen1/10878/ME000093S10397
MADSDVPLSAPKDQDVGITAPGPAEVVAALAEKVKEVVVGDKPAEAGAPAGQGPAKPAAKKDPKAAKKAERLAARMATQTQSASKEEDDPLAANYGDLPLEALQSKEISGRKWAKVEDLSEKLEGQVVLFRGRVHTVRGKGKSAFLVVREGGFTVQCIFFVGDHVSKGMVKYVSALSKESIVDVEGLVVVPKEPVEATSQQASGPGPASSATSVRRGGGVRVRKGGLQVEIQVRKVHTVSRAASSLPLNLEDASRSERDFEAAQTDGSQYVRVLQDTRLNNRWIDLRTPANQAIFRLQSGVSQEAGHEVDPFGDINTEAEKRLGDIIRQKYNTDFYMMYRYPLAARPFYTMPSVDDPRYTNSFDIFIRGEEIISGAQRVHEPELLAKRAGECGID